MEQIILSVLEYIMDLGYLGIAVGLMLEVIPSEIVLAYGGFMVHQGEITFIGAVIAGTIGGTLAQLFLYWLGYYGGRPLLETYGKYLLIQHKHLDMADQWFHKYGTGVIFTARFIPVVRHAISIPAGIAQMSFFRFTLYTTLAVIPWSIFFITLGYKLNEHWDRIDEVAAPYIRPVILTAIVLLIIYLASNQIWKKRRT